MTEFNLTITNETGRLDQVLAQQDFQLSRTQIKSLVKDGLITVNGGLKKISYAVNPGDQIQIQVPDTKPLTLAAENIPLDIIYEDDDVIVLNKPQGMVVHPSAGHRDHTLVNALLYHAKLAPAAEPFRPGIVHRIDKDTSGLLMVAKTALARESLERQLRDKVNKREYLAIVHGNFTEAKGKITAPIARSKVDRKKQAVDPNGRAAITHFFVEKQFAGFSLVKCVLETGRTHQIRVHMQYIKHPVAGDPIYAPKKTLAGNGQFLHAQTLGFYHPRTNKWLEFSVEPPKIFQEMLKKLANGDV
ncbi:pseudouridine synthase [Amylolactobacillus amylotrophicus DSM 20534]|uniref:Pseudouridine synthase n=3 Tax=Amylolactobacillus TaxID=2767876 RepID=A0A0R1YK33_9LACO|nr:MULTISPECIES: RluA family pseudouridine synthase [Amylolactobacillus]APT19200.1 pseudouridine synthase [Amylolactobacillus amylophilus DSM 20533 = JCM 1125]KRK38525.1 pseudouridine synthase [Amylolactobacillus amylotrophicus DSM 20534]KRM42832.1 pseudouridine synthase [Amylolactobacillus amylophilus DSM 20533 = JCM 1125]GED79695.1 pseudouridine synthase [Amylolactobacillus amylophilus]